MSCRVDSASTYSSVLLDHQDTMPHRIAILQTEKVTIVTGFFVDENMRRLGSHTVSFSKVFKASRFPEKDTYDLFRAMPFHDAYDYPMAPKLKDYVDAGWAYIHDIDMNGTLNSLGKCGRKVSQS